MDKLKELKALVETAEKDGALFYEKNNKAAGHTETKFCIGQKVHSLTFTINQNK